MTDTDDRPSCTRGERTCLHDLAAGRLTPTDLCDPCTAVMVGVLDNAVRGLRWHTTYNERAARAWADPDAGPPQHWTCGCGRRLDPPPTELLKRPEARPILAKRNIRALYRYLQKNGVSQRAIAAMTGQSQSEISEILSGRQVVSYDVLCRIADGLGVPRARMGLGLETGDDDAGGAE